MDKLIESYQTSLSVARRMRREYKKLELTDDASVCGSMINDLRFAIEWMEKGSEPLKHGIEKQSYVKREVLFDFNQVGGSLVIDGASIDKRVVSSYVAKEVIDDELHKQAEQDSEDKRCLVASIKKSLTARQIEILELVASGLTHKEVAAKLNITRRAVGMSIDESRRRIKDDGWLMV